VQHHNPKPKHIHEPTGDQACAWNGPCSQCHVRRGRRHDATPCLLPTAPHTGRKDVMQMAHCGTRARRCIEHASKPSKARAPLPASAHAHLERAKVGVLKALVVAVEVAEHGGPGRTEGQDAFAWA
jgi:hypothetical protein